MTTHQGQRHGLAIGLASVLVALVALVGCNGDGVTVDTVSTPADDSSLTNGFMRTGAALTLAVTSSNDKVATLSVEGAGVVEVHPTKAAQRFVAVAVAPGNAVLVARAGTAETRFSIHVADPTE